MIHDRLPWITMVLCSRCHLSEDMQPCLVGGRKPCSMCQEDMELERMIKELQDKCRILRGRMNAIHDPFNFKFPPEIGSLIFSLSIGKEDYKPHISTLCKLPTPFILGSVNQRWHQLARSTPQLWTTLSFTLEKPTKIPLLQAINDWLQLSGSLPLSIWIFSYSREPRTSPEICEPVIDALNQHSGRWGQVILIIHPHYFGRFSVISPPSNLYDLRLMNCNPLPGSNDVFPTFGMNSKPSPTNLTIQNFRLSAIDIGWGNLTTLAIGGMTINGHHPTSVSPGILHTIRLASTHTLHLKNYIQAYAPPNAG